MTPSDLLERYRGACDDMLQAVQSKLDAGCQVLAVIDPASWPQAWPQFGALAQARQGASLFVGTSNAQDTAVAPLLLPLHAQDRGLCEDLVSIALQAPAVVWVATHLGLADVQATLRAKLDAELAEDRRPLTLRYYDPRVMPDLCAALDANQQLWLHSGIDTWMWIDRQNQWASHTPSTSVGQTFEDHCAQPLALREAQVQTLLQASFVDRVVDVVERSMPSCLQPYDRVQRHLLASKAIAFAQAWKLTSEFDCASYLVVMEAEGGDFAHRSEWEKPMAAVKAGALRFEEAIAEWESRDDHAS